MNRRKVVTVIGANSTHTKNLSQKITQQPNAPGKSATFTPPSGVTTDGPGVTYNVYENNAENITVFEFILGQLYYYTAARYMINSSNAIVVVIDEVMDEQDMAQLACFIKLTFAAPRMIRIYIVDTTPSATPLATPLATPPTTDNVQDTRYSFNIRNILFSATGKIPTVSYHCIPEQILDIKSGKPVPNVLNPPPREKRIYFWEECGVATVVYNEKIYRSPGTYQNYQNLINEIIDFDHEFMATGFRQLRKLLKICMDACENKKIPRAPIFTPLKECAAQLMAAVPTGVSGNITCFIAVKICALLFNDIPSARTRIPIFTHGPAVSLHSVVGDTLDICIGEYKPVKGNHIMGAPVYNPYWPIIRSLALAHPNIFDILYPQMMWFDIVLVTILMGQSNIRRVFSPGYFGCLNGYAYHSRQISGDNNAVAESPDTTPTFWQITVDASSPTPKPVAEFTQAPDLLPAGDSTSPRNHSATDKAPENKDKLNVEKIRTMVYEGLFTPIFAATDAISFSPQYNNTLIAYATEARMLLLDTKTEMGLHAFAILTGTRVDFWADVCKVLLTPVRRALINSAVEIIQHNLQYREGKRWAIHSNILQSLFDYDASMEILGHGRPGLLLQLLSYNPATKRAHICDRPEFVTYIDDNDNIARCAHCDVKNGITEQPDTSASPLPPWAVECSDKNIRKRYVPSCNESPVAHRVFDLSSRSLIRARYYYNRMPSPTASARNNAQPYTRENELN